MAGAEVAVNREADVPGLDASRAERILRRAVQAVLEDRRIGAAEISVTLLDDAAMAAMNGRWKGRDDPTDVLAFALYAEGESPLGDIYVGASQAADQARAAGEPAERELARLAIHGTLHILGLDHPESDREGSELWHHQERILKGIDLS
jgi:probable rRNA maturation factor